MGIQILPAALSALAGASLGACFRRFRAADSLALCAWLPIALVYGIPKGAALCSTAALLPAWALGMIIAVFFKEGRHAYLWRSILLSGGMGMLTIDGIWEPSLLFCFTLLGLSLPDKKLFLSLPLTVLPFCLGAAAALFCIPSSSLCGILLWALCGLALQSALLSLTEFYARGSVGLLAGLLILLL